MAGRPHTGLVLSGGGVRGAYEVGVLTGILEVIDLPRGPFDIISGTSVGAMNGAYLAANADRADCAIDGLARIWRSLRLEEMLRVDPLGLLGKPVLRRRLQRAPSAEPELIGRSLLDPRPVARLVEEGVPWERLHASIASGLVRAMFVPALDVTDGRTTIFAEVAPGVDVPPLEYPRRRLAFEDITPDHVLASTALPLLYPARRIGDRYYSDGGVRFNTPIAPAIHAGADRLVVISLLGPTTPIDPVAEYPSISFLLGKLLNALILDPIVWDLENLYRMNRVFRVLEEQLSPATMAQVEGALEAVRGLPYRHLPALVFAPSEDIGALAAAFIRHDLGATGLGFLSRRLIQALAHSDAGQAAELAAFLLMDGTFAGRLIELGYRDALARRDDIRRFFEA